MSIQPTSRLILSSVPALAINLYPDGAERFRRNFVMYIAFALAAARPWTWRRLVVCGVLLNLLYGLATLIASEDDPNYANMGTFLLMIPIVVGSLVVGTLDMYSIAPKSALLGAVAVSVVSGCLCLAFSSEILAKTPREVYSYVLAAFGAISEVIHHRLRALILLVCIVAAAGHLGEVGQILKHGPVQVPLEALLVSGLSALGYVFLASSRVISGL